MTRGSIVLNKKRIVSLINGIGKIEYRMQKNEGGPLLYTTKKHEFGMDKILIRSGNLKFLKESIRGKNSLTLVLTIICLDVTPKTQATKAKISEWNDITLKSF